MGTSDEEAAAKKREAELAQLDEKAKVLREKANQSAKVAADAEAAAREAAAAAATQLSSARGHEIARGHEMPTPPLVGEGAARRELAEFRRHLREALQPPPILHLAVTQVEGYRVDDDDADLPRTDELVERAYHAELLAQVVHPVAV